MLMPTAAPMRSTIATVAGPSTERCFISQSFTPYSWSHAAMLPPTTTAKANRSRYTSRKGTRQRPPTNQATDGMTQYRNPGQSCVADVRIGESLH